MLQRCVCVCVCSKVWGTLPSLRCSSWWSFILRCCCTEAISSESRSLVALTRRYVPHTGIFSLWLDLLVHPAAPAPPVLPPCSSLFSGKLYEAVSGGLQQSGGCWLLLLLLEESVTRGFEGWKWCFWCPSVLSTLKEEDVAGAVEEDALIKEEAEEEEEEVEGGKEEEDDDGKCWWWCL